MKVPHNEGVSWGRRNLDFESTVRSEMPVLYRVARRFCPNEEEAVDLVQQTVIKAFRAWDRFDGQHVRSYLIRILRNENLMRLRARRAETVAIDDIAEPSVEPPWEVVLTREHVSKIMEELDKLPEEYRWAVQLCDIEQMTYEEAALAMDSPIGTVRSRLFRGRALIRARLSNFVEVTP